jgi:hypothetical protein
LPHFLLNDITKRISDAGHGSKKGYGQLMFIIFCAKYKPIWKIIDFLAFFLSANNKYEPFIKTNKKMWLNFLKGLIDPYESFYNPN